ncbi:hypothetical protein EYF80_030249 [Liparis tanakae]|uniref:Uncharacterized protein n=1 Tax=Liparis tanakae TaxID=230148 RepID=A0A4Z2H2J3_9TELE|nr:hypothetical protein EYF80_030249 [Liparis tanakae]
MVIPRTKYIMTDSTTMPRPSRMARSSPAFRAPEVPGGPFNSNVSEFRVLHGEAESRLFWPTSMGTRLS